MKKCIYFVSNASDCPDGPRLRRDFGFDETGKLVTSKENIKIDGKYYYFTANGSMDYSEYRDGCWLGADGAWDPNYSHGTWKSDANGWWYEDNGWYPTSQWLWIDGVNYYFGANGYMQ